MSKAVLISIRPKWCELIASGKKSIEVRKTRPKLETPFKCHIYCTLSGSKEFFEEVCRGDVASWNRSKMSYKKGHVIGEFVCDGIIEWSYIPDPDESADPGSMAYDALTKDGEATGLEYDDFEEYGKGKPLFGWHISDLVIYDEPKKLSDFRLYNTSTVIEHGLPMPTHEIKRPPQSWCYVEEGET